MGNTNFELLESVLGVDSGRSSYTSSNTSIEDSVYADLDNIMQEAMKATLRGTILESTLDSDDKVEQLSLLESADIEDDQILTFMETTINPILQLSGLLESPYNQNTVIVTLPLWETAAYIDSLMENEDLDYDMGDIAYSYDMDEDEADSFMESAADLIDTYGFNNIKPDIFQLSEVVTECNNIGVNLNMLFEDKLEDIQAERNKATIEANKKANYKVPNTSNIDARQVGRDQIKTDADIIDDKMAASIAKKKKDESFEINKNKKGVVRRMVDSVGEKAKGLKDWAGGKVKAAKDWVGGTWAGKKAKAAKDYVATSKAGKAVGSAKDFVKKHGATAIEKAKKVIPGSKLGKAAVGAAVATAGLGGAYAYKKNKDKKKSVQESALIAKTLLEVAMSGCDNTDTPDSCARMFTKQISIWDDIANSK